MTPSKIVFIGAACIFSTIAIAGFVKKSKKNKAVVFDAKVQKEHVIKIDEAQTSIIKKENKVVAKQLPQVKKEVKKETKVQDAQNDLPDTNIIDRLFATDSSRLPIVETVTYSSRVPWLQGKHAWISDYATYYSTTRHFIARSLNKKPDYFTQKVFPGDRFNVLAKDKNINFYLLIDLSRSKMWFYYIDTDTNERTLLKSYSVGLGRKDAKKASGFLTPIGKYGLGNKVAIYKPGTMGYFQENKTEMIKVFGTRWIPFDKEIENCSEASRGFGIHGAPWVLQNGELIEDKSAVSKYGSDGCVRLASEDVEELFSIIISRPTTLELVKDFFEAKLPGREKKIN